MRKAGLPALRFHDLRHMAGTLMHEAGVPLKCAQEILGHASERTTLAIYTHSMRRTHDDSADKIAALAGLSAPITDMGNIRETTGSVESQEVSVSDCFIGSPGRITRCCAPRPSGVALRALAIAAARRCRRTGLFYVGGSNLRRRVGRAGRPESKFFVKMAPRDGLLGAARLAPPGSPYGRSPSPLRGAVVEPACFMSAVRIYAEESVGPVGLNRNFL